MFEVKVTDQFSASHQLKGYDGACENLHGHNWQVAVVVKSPELDSMGVVVDFEEVKRVLREVLEEFDHSNINQLPEFSQKNPTAEYIAEYIHRRMKDQFSSNGMKITSVSVWETKDACATFRPV